MSKEWNCAGVKNKASSGQAPGRCTEIPNLYGALFSTENFFFKERYSVHSALEICVKWKEIIS